MKALVFHGPGQKAWENVPDPVLEQPTDVIVRIDSSTICGTDLHILKGDVPEVKPGTILGHEAVGTVVEKGSGVTTLEIGDRVLVSCITSCGRCRFCKERRYGLCAVMTARLFTPAHIVAIDLDDTRLEYARAFGADVTINNGSDTAVAAVLELTDGLGADLAIEAVGTPETFELCTELIRPGGRVANVGVHGHPATLHLETLWIKNVTITTGLVDTHSTPRLLKLVSEGRLDPQPFGTHHFKSDEILDSYSAFADAAKTNALKVVLTAV